MIEAGILLSKSSVKMSAKDLRNGRHEVWLFWLGNRKRREGQKYCIRDFSPETPDSIRSQGKKELRKEQDVGSRQEEDEEAVLRVALTKKKKRLESEAETLAVDDRRRRRKEENKRERERTMLIGLHDDDVYDVSNASQQHTIFNLTLDPLQIHRQVFSQSFYFFSTPILSPHSLLFRIPILLPSILLHNTSSTHSLCRMLHIWLLVEAFRSTAGSSNTSLTHSLSEQTGSQRGVLLLSFASPFIYNSCLLILCIRVSHTPHESNDGAKIDQIYRLVLSVSTSLLDRNRASPGSTHGFTLWRVVREKRDFSCLFPGKQCMPLNTSYYRWSRVYFLFFFHEFSLFPIPITDWITTVVFTQSHSSSPAHMLHVQPIIAYSSLNSKLTVTLPSRRLLHSKVTITLQISVWHIRLLCVDPRFLPHASTPLKFSFYPSLIFVPERSKQWECILFRNSKAIEAAINFPATAFYNRFLLSLTAQIPQVTWSNFRTKVTSTATFRRSETWLRSQPGLDPYPQSLHARVTSSILTKIVSSWMSVERLTEASYD